MRFLIVGNGAPAKAALAAVLAMTGAEVAAFYTSEREGGWAADLACQNGVDVRPEERLQGSGAAAEVGNCAADWLLSANSVTILSPSVLAAVGGRALNFHPGLLPSYAGLHAHQWAIRNGETDFGVTVHLMEEGIDTGDIVAIRRFAIRAEDTGLTLFQRCIREGGQLLTEVVNDLCAGRSLPRQRQDLSRRRLYKSADAQGSHINWRWTARRIHDFVRAGNYAPLSSPTYTATLPPAGDLQAIHLLACKGIGCPAKDCRPGTILAVDRGLWVACADDVVWATQAVEGGRPLTDADWRHYAAALPQPWALAMES